jgi:hypothetical protein
LVKNRGKRDGRKNKNKKSCHWKGEKKNKSFVKKNAI